MKTQIKNLFHAHVTYPKAIDPKQIPKGWKATTIVLSSDVKEQTDYMLTKHYSLGKKKIFDVQDVFNDVRLLNVGQMPDRIKLEQTSGFTLHVDNYHYVEAHVKCAEGTPKPNPNWVISKNPSEIISGKPHFFYNRRIYWAKDVPTAQKMIDEELTGTIYLEKKIEQVIYDSNRAVDKWWA